MAKVTKQRIESQDQKNVIRWKKSPKDDTKYNWHEQMKTTHCNKDRPERNYHNFLQRQKIDETNNTNNSLAWNNQWIAALILLTINQNHFSKSSRQQPWAASTKENQMQKEVAYINNTFVNISTNSSNAEKIVLDILPKTGIKTFDTDKLIN